MFEAFMTSWEALADKQERLKPFIDIGLRKAREYYGKMDHTKAYIIALGEYFKIFSGIKTQCRIFKYSIRVSR